jgi:hypothetical protein
VRLAHIPLRATGAHILNSGLSKPGMRQPSSLRPTPDGIGLAKDVWLLGAGLTLLLDRHRAVGSGED